MVPIAGCRALSPKGCGFRLKPAKNVHDAWKEDTRHATANLKPHGSGFSIDDD
jgi:hypothetical protein